MRLIPNFCQAVYISVHYNGDFFTRIVYKKLGQSMEIWHNWVNVGEMRISEISPPLLSGSGLYKNLSFSRPMSIFCLPEPLLSPFTKLFPPFFIASSFFCSLCRFKAQPMDSLLVCFAKHIVHNFVVVKLT